MCGICGEIRFDGQQINPDSVYKMSETMVPRGPDGSGLILRDRHCFGHRRLKIVDLSEKSGQPMVDSELGYSCVFNGMIYNYQEIREELVGHGYRFFSNGDTEVLLKAYHCWGPECVDRFAGMFAFAIVERDSGKVIFGRDRLGIKPFYYARVDGGLIFASSLPAILATGRVSREIDPVALHHYMSFHAVVPAPYTMLKSIRKLSPATLMMIDPDGTSKEINYWSPDYPQLPEDQGRSFEEWQELLMGAMRKAVDRRMVADVPVGVLLSGGIDSSLVVGLLAEAGVSDLKTFSIGFESVGGEDGDEFKYSDVIARHFSTDHHQIRIGSEETLSTIRDCVKAMSEPMVSHDNIGFYLLSREVSKHVKVVQSGQGADEIFGGYHWYPPLMESRNALADYSRVFFDSDHAGFAVAVNPELVSEDFSSQFVREHFAKPGADRPIDKAMRLDSLVMLVDDPVKRVDNMTMAWGLEARVPFLDHEVVELAARIPPEYKVGNGGKYVLKEASRKVIPADVIDRPKGYFPVPALKYIQGEYLAFVKEVLSDPRSKNRKIFQQDYIDGLLDSPADNITPLGSSRLWQVALLELWLQNFI
ncbi:N-acetylglutaminylglutamine amidotransferase [Desulfonatronovibrio magnus]|uniref:N-acetylglutaminylglutamine amidotransferase n=1 Tax=Desulfonatronovibrio magnus TaxID=698827 RepID=UPI0005EBE504|nr:N-acetylglutaminylglutamine amidotransferase [Desulfonatronovibrio magnus]RQD56941.1 MAG: N-acetylglutaminylglutamine amidotransferase [Desulfonatronovibrio sp. MSAO_Bac4]